MRSQPNKSLTCALCRFPVAPRGNPSAVDIPLLQYLALYKHKILYQHQARPLWRQCVTSLEWLQIQQSFRFPIEQRKQKLRIKVLKFKWPKNSPENSRTTALFATPASSSKKHWRPHTQDWGVQILFGACLCIQALIWTVCSKWGLRCFSLPWHCGKKSPPISLSPLTPS